MQFAGKMASLGFLHVNQPSRESLQPFHHLFALSVRGVERDGLFGLSERALYHLRQAREVILRNVVRGATPKRLDQKIFIRLSGDKNERRLATAFLVKG